MIRHAALCVSLVAFAAFGGSPVAAEDEEIQVHEWSFWIVDSTIDQANALAAYPSMMPGVVETDRSRANDSSPFSPVHVMTLYGQDVADAEIDLRIQSGRFVAHWPKADKKNNRLRWLELALSTAEPASARPADVDEKHWFQQARSAESLHIAHAGRRERFITYDVELNAISSPLKLTGGPDTYRLLNVSPYELRDVIVTVPTPEGVRIGRIDLAPAPPPTPTVAPAATAPAVVSTPAAAPAGAPTAVTAPTVAGVAAENAAAAASAADEKLKAETVAREAATAAEAAATAAAEDILDDPSDVPAKETKVEETPTPAATAEPAPAAAPAEVQPAPAAPEGVEVVMGPALSADDPQLAALKTDIIDNLVKAGLKPAEAELFYTTCAQRVVSAKEMTVLVRLPGVVLDEKLPLVIYPSPTRSIRVPMLLVRNIDPSIKDEVSTLTASLGADDYKSREAAEKRLKELGRLAVPALKEALKSPDLETVFRAERILLSMSESIDGA